MGEVVALQSQLVDVQSIYSTGAAFAALKTDGSIVSWGCAGEDENGHYVDLGFSQVRQQLATDVQSIYHTDHAFAALKADGSLITWGDSKEFEEVESKALALKHP